MSYFVNHISEQSLDWWFRWLTILAIGLPIIGATFGGLCGYTAFLVSNRTSDLQAVALRHAEATASEARELAKPRHLLPEQTAKMEVAARQVCINGKRIPVTAANSNQEAQAYALDFVTLLRRVGCQSDLALPIPGLTADVQGVRVGVRSLESIPADAVLLGKILFAGDVSYQVNPLKEDFFPGEPFVLIIGAKST